MSGYALDTNIISYLLRGNLELQECVYREANHGKGVSIPPIVYYEIKRGLIHKQAFVKLEAFNRLCDILGVTELDIETLDRASDIYAERSRIGRPMEDADILIAATCVANDYTLVTNNSKHFEGVHGLKFTNWVR